MPIQIQEISTKEKLEATRRLLKESLEQLDFLVRTNPRLGNSDISSVIERCRVAVEDKS